MLLLYINDLPVNFQGVKLALSHKMYLLFDKNEDLLQQKNLYAMKELEVWFQNKIHYKCKKKQ